MRLRTLAIAFAGFYAFNASAEWSATVEDDIFSGGKKAVLFGVVDNYRALIFNCDSESLEFALVGRSQQGEKAATLSATIVTKVDEGEIQRFKAATSQRNDTHWQVVASDRAQILDLLNQIRDAQDTIQVGVQVPETNFKMSGVASAANSTRETDRFISACKLQ